MLLISRIIKDVSTAKDGESYDVGRILWVVGAVVFLGLSAYAVYRSGTFDFLGFGGGYGGLLAGGGAAIKLKQNTEPGQ